jgi:polysaccharide export outer membrane protein
LAALATLGVMEAQQQPPPTAPQTVSPQPAQPPTDFVIGPEDVLGIVFWRDETMSGDVTVRPDGNITVPLINEIKAAGLTPEQLRLALLEAAKKFVAEPTVSVIVRQINSRKVFVTGQVTRPAAYPLIAPTTVMQMIANAGGLNDYADGKKIVIIRTEAGRQTHIKFNYEDVRKGKKLEQNILLKPGDTIVVP